MNRRHLSATHATTSPGAHHSVNNMLEDLQRSEEDFQNDVNEFRTDLNSLPSTFLELYDITENSPTGTH